MQKSNITIRLILMNILQYGIWGAYLTSMGGFLGKIGLTDNIWLFFATQGFVSIFMPTLMGIVADKWIPAQKTLSLCHGLAGILMLAVGFYAMNNIDFIPQVGDVTAHYTMNPGFSFGLFFALYTLSVAFYMPTIAISNSVAYNALEVNGKDPVKDFPPIRIFGTIGFIAAMLLENFAPDLIHPEIKFQHSFFQFYVSGILGVLLCGYALTMPNCPCKPKSTEKQSFIEASGLSAFSLFKDKQFAIFFIFSMLLGASLQITNGYANTYITSFADLPQFANAWGAKNANALISLSQVSETLCILLIPIFLKKLGIKKVMLISMFAWVFRFGFFGLGNPGSGIWLFLLSCIVYGVAFDFFNISGSLYVNENTDKGIRSSAQGLFMLMTNGLGASIGTWAAGKVVKALVPAAQAVDGVVVNGAEVTAGWQSAWYVFAAYAFVVGLLFMILFKDPTKKTATA